MIEPTDEMADAFRRAEVAYWEAREAMAEGMTVAEHGRAAYRAGLKAAFELVERDYCVLPGAPRCPAATGSFRCDLVAGHDGMHTSSHGWAEMSW